MFLVGSVIIENVAIMALSCYSLFGCSFLQHLILA